MDHDLALEILCRVCGHRCLKWSETRKHTVQTAIRFQEELLNIYSINVGLDIHNIHPRNICKSCITSLKKPTGKPVTEWNVHSSECVACDLYKCKRRPGYGKVAAKRRQERRAKELVDTAISDACDTILGYCVEIRNPPTKKLQQVASLVVKKMLESGPNTIQLPTGGPKLTLQKLVTPRVSSDAACNKTVRERSKQIQENINMMSTCATEYTNSNAAADLQLANILRLKSPQELEDFLHVNDLLKIRIPTGEELAMKVQLGWSWAQMRKMKIWLREYNVFMAAESVTRKQRAEILGNALQAEMLPFFFTEDEERITKEAAIVYIPNMVDHIMASLDDLDKFGFLSKKGGRIGLKLGGDKGGGTTKMFYQILNVPSPNSRLNSIVFCAYEADDSVPNMHIALDRYTSQINSLLDATWQGMPIDLYMCGDFAMDSKLLGLQGASATYPCISCHVKKEDINENVTYENRTLQTIKADHQQVQQDGYTRISKRTNHSVSHEPFFNIPIQQICPPVLHINLGLWNKFYNHLVKDVQQLGEKIADCLAEKPEDADTTEAFTFYIHNISEAKEEMRKLQDKSQEIRDEVVELEFDMITQGLLSPVTPNQQQMDTVDKLLKQAKKLDDEAAHLRDEFRLTEDKNPLIAALDKTLEQFKVRRQAYHSKTFVGNHVHKCLKKENYTRLLSSVVDATMQLCPELEDAAVSIQMKYFRIFEQFGKCYHGYTTSNAMTPEQVDVLEADINELVRMYMEKWPGQRLTPKFHFLWKHTVPFIRRIGMGLGVLSEQGGEQLHNEFNILARRFLGSRNIQGMTPSLYHLKKVMEEHLVKVHPSMRKRIVHTEE